MGIETGEWITPPETREIANEFRAAADRIREVYHAVQSAGSQLDATWVGNAKNIFDSHFDSFPREIAAYADHLDQMAHEILQIQVWITNKPE